MTSNLTYSGVPEREDREVPGGRARATGAAHADERSAAHADVLDLPDAGLLLRDIGAERGVQQRLRLRPRLLLAEHRHHLGRRSSAQERRCNGVDGPGPTGGNESHDPNSTHTVPEASTQGTWIEEADLRPTLLHLVGLHDDYQTDGQVITQALTARAARWPGRRARCAVPADQLQRRRVRDGHPDRGLEGVGERIGVATTRRTPTEQTTLLSMADHRDRVAALMKATLARAATGHRSRSRRAAVRAVARAGRC